MATYWTMNCLESPVMDTLRKDCGSNVLTNVLVAAPRSYHGMATLDNEIYIIGGFSGQVYLSSCCKFKPETLTWQDVTPMNTKR